MLADYAVQQGYALRLAIEPKPNEPRGDIFLPTVGHALHFIETLARPEMIGVNPEVAHETMAGLSVHHAVGQALWAGKLFHIDLNAQRVGRYDQDYRFGAEDLKEAFLLVRLLERAGYDGPLHFDAHPYRNEDPDGVWDFVAGCMRTYDALAERAAHFDALPAVQAALAAAGTPELAQATAPGGAGEADALKGELAGLDALADRGYANEALDQLVVDVLLGRAMTTAAVGPVACGPGRCPPDRRRRAAAGRLARPPRRGAAGRARRAARSARVHGSHAGIPLLHPWANRLAAERYGAAGLAADVSGAAVGRDAAGLPIHGLLAAAGAGA